MKRFITAAMIAASLIASAKVTRGYESHPEVANSLMLRVDSIDYRSDLTRVYSTLEGRPHTSNRIDKATFAGQQATDIEGVDFQRYFQWEDDGQIPVEIDFPAMRRAEKATLTLDTPRGQSVIFVRKK